MPNPHHPRYLLRWDHSLGLEVGRNIIATSHRVGELGLAADERLADLIDQHPRDAITVHTMGTNPAYRNQWRAGELGRIDGQQLIEAVQRGRLWVVLDDVASHDQQIHDVTRRLERELVECHVGLRIHHPTAQLVLASPGTMQYYRCDPRPTIRWQLRGQQTVLTYPTCEPFVHPLTYADVLVRQACDGMYFEPAFDQHAQRISIDADQMIALPQPTPYRVECGSGLNIWLQTQYDDRATIRRRNICLTNRWLRSCLPAAWSEHHTAGLWAAAKNVCAPLAGLVTRSPPVRPAVEPSFTVEAPIDSPSANPIAPVHSLPANTTSVVLEN